MILPWVLPEDLENFAQSCKVVHQQANRQKGGTGYSLLQEHRYLNQKYSVLSKKEDVVPYLRAINTDQRIARYVQKMTLNPFQRSVEPVD